VPVDFEDTVKRLRTLLGERFMILGGAVRDMYCLGKFTTDVDVFVDHQDFPGGVSAKLGGNEFDNRGVVGHGRANPYMRSGVLWVEGYVTKTSLASRGNPGWEKGIPVQVVVTTDPVLALHSFDWTICQFGYQPGVGFFATRQALESWHDKKLYLFKCHAFSRTVERMVKLAKRLGLGVDEASVSILHHRAQSETDFERLKNKPLSRPKVPGDKKKRMTLAQMKDLKDANMRKDVDSVIKGASMKGMNVAAVMHQLRHHMGFELGPLARALVDHDMPNLRWLVEYAEGRMMKPTNDFEVGLTVRRPVGEVTSMVTDFDVFHLHADHALAEFRLFRANVQEVITSFEKTRDIVAVAPERDRYLQRLAKIEQAMVDLLAAQEADFAEGLVTTVHEPGSERAKIDRVRLGKFLGKLVDHLEKLPDTVSIGTLKPTEPKNGEPPEDRPKVGQITAPAETRLALVARAKVLYRTFEQRGRAWEAPEFEGVDFVVSNDFTDLMTISTSGPWGSRCWTSCQKLGSDIGYYRSVAANTRHTLVAYLAKGTDWLGRVLLRVNPQERAIAIERFYGNDHYHRALMECIQQHLGAHVKPGVVYSGYDYLPYSDCYSPFWGKHLVPSIDTRMDRTRREALAEPEVIGIVDQLAGPERDPDEWDTPGYYSSVSEKGQEDELWF
jgi:hypothetical protein